ncbi:MAG: hypothetical protein RM049_15700 [Nostoc sp. DedQUE04]|uniref:hypothetical protein n=1 Tax=Nostoc sp. DedQUE04 TaxID=3075390 RepID=UPI002AD50DD6|nr:hypothetical protein [Nostoc sp. DedQUE04]MDZ8136729.1 hypothetical protein [Nostoc sp. DedQUE04]
MPRGIPKAGKRNSGGGRKKKFDSPTVRRRIPTAFAEKIEMIHSFLLELDDEISKWEQVCDEKITSPRYERARQLVLLLREKLDTLGLDVISSHSINDNNKGE